MCVWGIDPSTVRISCAARGPGFWVVESVGVQSPQGSRLALIFKRGITFFRALAERFPPDEVWIEQPSGPHLNLQLVYAVGAVGGAVGVAVPGVPLYTVPPSTWKLAAFGKGNGNAGKPYIMERARAEGYEGAVQDEADALGISKGGMALDPRTTKQVLIVDG